MHDADRAWQVLVEAISKGNLTAYRSPNCLTGNAGAWLAWCNDHGLPMWISEESKHQLACLQYGISRLLSSTIGEGDSIACQRLSEAANAALAAFQGAINGRQLCIRLAHNAARVPFNPDTVALLLQAIVHRETEISWFLYRIHMAQLQLHQMHSCTE